MPSRIFLSEAAVTPSLQHTTVLLHEAVDALLGNAGPSLPVPGWMPPSGAGAFQADPAEAGAQGNLVAFDKDPEAIQEAARITDARFPFGTKVFAIWASCLRAVPLAC